MGRNPKTVTRQRILEAATDMFRARQLTPGGEQLRVVLDELGYSTGAGYQIWNSQAEFRSELAAQVAGSLEVASVNVFVDELTRQADLGAGWRQAAQGAFDRFLVAVRGSEDFYLRLWFLAGDPAASPAVFAALGDATAIGEETTERFVTTLARFDRTPGPGSATELLVAVTALAEGLALRARINNGETSRSNEAMAIVGLLGGLTSVLADTA